MDQLQAMRMGQHLLEYASRWWAGEAEVARTFFSRPHPPEEHLRRLARMGAGDQRRSE